MSFDPPNKQDNEVFDEVLLGKKLERLNRSADCIQTVSLWILHHRNHHERIVQQWFSHLQEGSPNKRLLLFYLANDVIQNCSRKSAHIFHEQFLEYVTKSIPYLRCKEIRSEIERIFVIWRERKVYPDWNIKTWIGDLKRELKTPADKESVAADYNPHQLCNLLEACRVQCEQFSAKHQALATFELPETANKFREKSKGEEYQAEVQTLQVRCQRLTNLIMDQLKMRRRLIEMLEQAMIFYEMQYSDAKVVALAYKNFGTKVADLKRKLNELKELLPKSAQNFDPVMALKRKRSFDHGEKEYISSSLFSVPPQTTQCPSMSHNSFPPHFPQSSMVESPFPPTIGPGNGGAVHQAAAMLVAYSSQLMHPQQGGPAANMAPFAPAYFYQPANADVDCRFGTTAMMSGLPLMQGATIMHGTTMIPGASFMHTGSMIPPGSLVNAPAVPSNVDQTAAKFERSGPDSPIAAGAAKQLYESPSSKATIKDASRSRSSSRSHSICRTRHK